MNRIIRFSGIISFSLLLFIILAMIIATVYEKINGTDFVLSHFYYSPWFIACWLTLAIYSLIYIYSKKLYKRTIIFFLHIALVIILLGALITHLTSKNGVIKLRQNIPNHFYNDEKRGGEVIPFTVKLISFRIEYYKGTNSPSDYVSRVEINDPFYNNCFETEISMNHILKYRGYRFYQSSFDSDLKGSILQVSYDVYGIPITYTGYYLLFAALLLSLFSKKTRFRRLLKSNYLKKSLLIVAVLFIINPLSKASTLVSCKTISKEQAAKLDFTWVLYNGRIVPLQTFAIDFTKKLYGSKSYNNFNATQVLAGWLLFPSHWRDDSFISIKNDSIAKIIGVSKASFSVFFDNEGHYKLASFFNEINPTKSQSVLRKELIVINDKINLIAKLLNSELLLLFPLNNANSVDWVSFEGDGSGFISLDYREFIDDFITNYRDALVKGDEESINFLLNKLYHYQNLNTGLSLPSKNQRCVELLYNKLDTSLWSFKVNLLIALLLIALYIFEVLKGYTAKFIHKLAFVFLIIMFLVQTLNLFFRAYISGRLPLANGFETMLFIAWCALFIGLLLYRYSLVLVALSFLISGFALLVANISSMNPQITNLIPVLSSPLLSIHVSVIMFSYSLIAFLVLNSLLSFILMACVNKGNVCFIQNSIKRLRVLSELFLYPSVFFLAIGIFIGAIWANVSWGRYWGWDPKEVWALITLLIAALPLHRTVFRFFDNLFFFNLYLLLIFLAVLMTYFGVNYFFSGLHSYSGTADTSFLLIYLMLFSGFLFLLILLAYSKYKRFWKDFVFKL